MKLEFVKLVIALGVFAIFGLALYGWGWAVRRLTRARDTSWPATMATGLAAVVFIGGVLNLARLAYAGPLAGVAAAGIGLGMVAIIRGERPRIEWIALLLSLGVLGFVVVTQVPPRAYNFHDDYQKYFAHPVRMLETGTVFGSPLNDIGLDTLGGKAFLDGFAVAFFPIPYINGVDAAFALFLCMLLASQFRSIVAVLSVVVINPQYVNTSALYTAALLMMAVMEEEASSAWVTGLLYAGLIALKSTFALFVVVHLAAALLVRGVKWAGLAAVALVLFLAPWILLHARHYVAFLGGGGAEAAGARATESFNIFSPEELDYGSTALAYTGLMIAVSLCGVLIARVKRKVDMTAAACFATVAAYLTMVYLSGPRNAGYQQAIRYFAPFAIGVFPAAIGAAALAFSGIPKYRWAPVVIGAVPLLAFVPSLRDRVEQAAHAGNVLAFTWLAPEADYLEYNRQVLYGDMRSRVEAAQAKIPVGDAVVAWINAPFYLNFARNRVADVEPGAGLIAPWSKAPEAKYFIWEYGGYATVDEVKYAQEMADGPDLMRRVSGARLRMSRRFAEMLKGSERLYDDGSIVVFKPGMIGN